MRSYLVRASRAIALAVVGASACSAETGETASGSAGAGVEKVVFVAHFRVPCTGVGEQECLMVRESEDAEWTMRYDPIVGFEHEPGYEYRLAIAEQKVADPPADASALRWTLVEVVEKSPVEAADASGMPVEGVWALASFGPAVPLGESAGQVEAALAGLPADRPVTMDLTEPGRVSGHAGCNNYFADFTVQNGHQLTMGPAGSTRMACEEGLMALEQAFFTRLEAASMVFIAGDEMELHSGDDVLLTFRRTEGAE